MNLDYFEFFKSLEFINAASLSLVVLLMVIFVFTVAVKCSKGFFEDQDKFEILRDVVRETRDKVRHVVDTQRKFQGLQTSLDNIMNEIEVLKLDRIDNRSVEIKFNQKLKELNDTFKSEINERSKRRLEILEAEKSLVILKTKFLELRNKGKVQ